MMIDIISGITAVGELAALGGFFCAVCSLMKDNTRKLRQSTIDFFSLINQETAELIDKVMIDGKAFYYRAVVKDHKLHGQVRRYLSLMERFAVGIRSHMYDAQVFDRMHGNTTLRVHCALIPYLDNIEIERGSRFYGDYTWLIGELVRIRKERLKKHKDCEDEHFPKIIMPWNTCVRVKKRHKKVGLEEIVALLQQEEKGLEQKAKI